MKLFSVKRLLSGRWGISRSVSVDAFVTYVAHGAPLGAGLVLMYLINTYSGVDTYGRLAILVASTSLVGNLLGARTGAAVVKFYVRESISGEIGRAKTIVFLSLLVDLALGGAALGVVAATSGLIAKRLLQEPALAGLVVLHSFVILARHSRRSMLGYLEAHRLFRLVNICHTLEALLRVGLVAGYFIVLQDSRLYGVVVSYVIASILATLLVVIAFVVHARKEFGGICRSAPRQLMVEYTRYNLKWFWSSAVATGWEHAQQIILALFATPAIVGTYQIIKNFLAPLHLIGTPFNLLTFPTMSRLYAEGRIYELRRYMNRLTWFSVPLAGLVAVALNAVIGPLVGLFGVAVDTVIRMSFAAISVRSAARLYVWWARNISSLVDPMIDFYRNVINALSFLGLVIVAWWLLADSVHPLLLISLATLVANIPAYVYALRVYRSRL